MDLKKKIFGSFDFRCVDDPEYKEDAVREDIIAPLLKDIGYSPTGQYKLIRSRKLTHPYVLFGTQKRKINIVPDYLIEIDGNTCFILDAKSPSQEVLTGDNVAQVYSYAIHPEVRAFNYGLCNGRSLALFEITSIKPKCVYDLMELDNTMLLDILQKLNPRTIAHKDTLDYYIDGGMYLHLVMNVSPGIKLFFRDVIIPNIALINNDLYSINAVCADMADRNLMFTFDFDRKMLDILLDSLPQVIANDILSSFKSRPFKYQDITGATSAHIRCELTDEPQFSRTGEMFFPLRVTDFQPTEEPPKGL